jgi:hypothetical protein
MGFLSDLNRKRKKVTKKIVEPFTKGFAKVTNKLIPDKFRFLSPYAAGISSLMLPPTMSPFLRALASGGLNVAGQIAADESATGELSDINMVSTALASGLGALGSKELAGNMRGGIEKGMGTGVDQFGDIPVPYTDNPGFLQGTENVGRSGIAAASDYVTGGRENLVNLGKNPADLFSSADKFAGARNAMSALAPTTTLATGDVAYEDAVDRTLAAEALDAEEQATFDATNKATAQNRATLQMGSMRQAGIPEDTVEETLAMNNLSEFYVPPQNAAYGGLMGRPEYEFGGITEALMNSGSRGLMTENRAMGGMMGMSSDPTYHQVRDQSGPVNLQGMMGYNMGGSVLPQGMEMDYRQGGFIPMGSKERADDVPARVSKNEFVMTADAVRATGGGSVNQGAKRMYDLMNNLEAKA